MTSTGSKATQGSQGSKRSFLRKMLLLLQITWHGHETYTYIPAWTPPQKLWVEKNIRGHIGSQGSKVQFFLENY